MELVDLLGNVRSCIGDPSVDDVTDRSLMLSLDPVLQYLAAELEFAIVTEEQALGLTAGTYTYSLPEDVDRLLWVEWNGNRLTASSVPRWIRDGRNWRGATAANPQEYAVQGRELVVYPPPSADAITTAAYLPLSYIATSPGAGEAGVTGLSDADLWTAAYLTGADWLGKHPGADDATKAERQALLTAASGQGQAFLAQAKRRRERPVETYTKKIRYGPVRRGAAR